MRFGILGYGKMGRIRHQALREVLPEAEVEAWDPGTGSPQAELDAVLERSQAVFICTPTHRNAPLTIRALEAGCHVFCEKPPALDHDQLLEVARVHARHPGATLLYGFNHRRYDSVERMQAVVASGQCGRVLWLRGRYGKPLGDPGTGGWRSDPAQSGGGILIDQGIHMLDLMSLLGGPFDQVTGLVTNTMWGVAGIEDNAFVTLYNSRDAVAASVHSTMIEWRYVFSLEVLLEHGYMALNGLKTPSGSYGREILTIGRDKKAPREATGAERRLEFADNTSWIKEVGDFVASIRAGAAATNLEAALEVMRMLKEVYRGWR